VGADPEPADWTISAEDQTAELQQSGAVDFSGYLSGEATNAPVTISLADIKATTATE
jgi:hypothetical protein